MGEFEPGAWTPDPRVRRREAAESLGGLGFQFPVFAIGKRRIGELLREYLDHDLGHYVLHRLPVSERNFADVFVGFGTQVYGVLLYHDIIVY